MNDAARRSLVEGNLDFLFNVESLGISDGPISNIDDQQINKFKTGITLREGRYHVELPWYPDKICLTF